MSAPGMDDATRAVLWAHDAAMLAERDHAARLSLPAIPGSLRAHPAYIERLDHLRRAGNTICVEAV